MATKTTPLQRAAAAQDDAARQKQVGEVLGALATLLGVPQPDAKMSKRTETTKHTIVEEDDAPPNSEEEEEAMSDSEKPSTEKSMPASSEEEEEEAAAKGEAEEEEEKAIAKAWRAAEREYAKVAAGVDAYGVHGPKGLRKAAEKATGATTIKAAIVGLRDVRKTSAKREEGAIKAHADLAVRVAKVEAAGRGQRIDAIVQKAKAEGRASTRELRAELQAFGMEHGSKALARFVATLPVAAKADARVPKNAQPGAGGNAPTADEQGNMMERAMSGLSPKERAEFLEVLGEKQKLNGAARREEA